MTLGERIRDLRLKMNMTQSQIAGDKITRNMLSAIESDKALPSLDTLEYICKKLEAPISYVLSEEDDLGLYRKHKTINKIIKHFSEKKYVECISLIESIGMIDDELAYLAANSNFHLGVSAAKLGAFETAERYFCLADKYAKMTVYDTVNIECKIPLYRAFVKNVNAPLLDFDKDKFYDTVEAYTDYEFYRYLCNDFDYPYKNLLFKKHMNAKMKIKERKYYDAIEILSEITESRSEYDYNVYFMYCVYGDLDNCYKQVCDFENAYKYSAKRISMLESFNS